MADDLNQVPAPPPGFSPVQNAAVPPPPPGFRPVSGQPQYSGIGQDQDPAEVAARHARSVADARVRGLVTNQPDQEDFMDKVRTGIGKDAVSTISGAANLANKVLPSSLQIPTEQRDLEKLPEWTEQQRADKAKLMAEAKDDLTLHGLGEHVGGLAENLAEFEGLSAATRGLSVMAKLPEAVVAMAEKYPKLAKALMAAGGKATGAGAEITKAAVAKGKPALETAAKLAEVRPGIAGAAGTIASATGTAAAQSAVKESATGGAGAKAGAEEGAIGGALGSSFAEVTGPAIGKLLRSMGIGTDAEADIMRAVQTGKRDTSFLDDWKVAQPRISKEIENAGEDFKDLGEAADRIGDVRRKIWTDEVMPAIDRHANEVFDTTGAANAVRARITPELQKNFPRDAKVLQKIADRYTAGTPLFTGDKTVTEAEKEIELYNAKLGSKGYWAKDVKGRAEMEKADPEIGAWRSLSDELRNGLYQHLSNAGEPNMAALKNEYGAVGHIEDAVRGQVNVAARQRPVSLKQMVGMAAGVAHGGVGGMIAAALPVVDKLYNEPAALLNRALAKSEPAGPIKQAAKNVVAAAKEPAKKAAAVTGANMVRFLASDGSTHSVNADQLEAAKKIDPNLKVLQ